MCMLALAMASYVALLRAVNLAGKNTISMGDLRAVTQKVGLCEPRTLGRPNATRTRSHVPPVDRATADRQALDSHECA